MAILLMVIGGHYINGYWRFFYWCLLVAIVLMVIGDYYINGY
jgi:hypothetical protein